MLQDWFFLQQVGAVMDMIAATGPESYFGFATFADKPISGFDYSGSGKRTTLGYSTDYCLHVDASLAQPNARDMTALFNAYYQTAAGGMNRKCSR